MATIERRVQDLEQARSALTGPLVLFVDVPPTDEQLRAIEEAKRIGRPVVPLRADDADL